MTNAVNELSFFQVILSYVFMLIVLFILKKRGIKREKELIISSLRMSLQLFVTGNILVYILKNPSVFVTMIIIVLMEVFTVFTIFRKFNGKLTKRLKIIVAFSIIGGTLFSIFYFLLIVVQIKPWYNPQYFIPIGGMLIGNAMTAVTLGLNSLINGMTTQKSIVEEALILGATPALATKSIIDSSFDSAIMPTINSMIGMGIIFLPGMMTGQILSGTLPTTAIAYQIAIMLGILGSVSLSVSLLLHFGYKSYFNKDSQISFTETK